MHSCKQAEGAGRRNFVLCAEDGAQLFRWLTTIWAFNFRRVKSISFSVCEELRARGLQAQGLFRVRCAVLPSICAHDC